MIKHIKKWLQWNKYSADSPLVKIAVLFGMKVPSFEYMWTDEEFREIFKEELWADIAGINEVKE